MIAARARQGRPSLPTIVLGSKGCFVDLQARLFRETMDPGRHIDFDSVKGTELCKLAGVVTCLRCGASVMAAGSLMDDKLRCVRCGGWIQGTRATANL